MKMKKERPFTEGVLFVYMTQHARVFMIKRCFIVFVKHRSFYTIYSSPFQQ